MTSATISFSILFCSMNLVASQSTCSDLNEYCEEWADRGECDVNPSFMKLNCKLTCEKCSASEVEPIRDAHEPESIGEAGHAMTRPTVHWLHPNQITVCWETPGWEKDKATVAKWIDESWPQHSAVRFLGWNDCGPSGADIRIMISDEQPQVEHFGSDLKNVKNGMILNFEFKNWQRRWCRHRRATCMKGIAIHEFGHALGLQHEQNHPDAPGWCKDKHGNENFNLAGLLITKYDTESIMNYCSTEVYNGAELSKLDKRAIQWMYPSSKSCPSGEFSCGNGRCLLKEQICDGMDNCGNAADEAETDGVCTGRPQQQVIDGYCADQIYNIFNSTCCNSNIITLATGLMSAYDSHSQCCNGKSYNSNIHKCVSDKITRGQPIRPTEQPQRNTNACAKEDNRSRRQVSLQDVTNSNNNFGCAPTLQAADCNQNLCYHQKYRSFDGNCNNLQRPLFGAAYQPLKRVQPPIYDDGRQLPQSRYRLPLAREASRFLLSSTEVVSSTNFNGLMMQWGQFLSHDIARTTMMNSSQCGYCGSSAAACFNIPTVQQDLRFGPQRCLELPRSTPVCGGNGVREQFNENTAFLDASQVYGSSAADAAALRNGFSPFLRTSNIGGRVYPPTDSNCNFLAGDDRANLFIGLTAFHTLFVREHNRIAGSR